MLCGRSGASSPGPSAATASDPHVLDCSFEGAGVSDRPRDETRHTPVTTSITTDATGELLMPLLAADTGPARAWDRGR